MISLRKSIKNTLRLFGFRLRQTFFFIWAGISVVIGVFSIIKSYIVSRMFWGRGTFYRNSFHIVIAIVTISILVTGISTKLNVFGAQANGLGLNDPTIGQDDVFSQSGTSQALVLIQGDAYDYTVDKYEVQQGDTLSSIAQNYGVNVKTLMWANNISNQNVALTVGQVLKIPSVDGVFYTVKKDDTVDSVAKTTKSTPSDILDFNTNVIDVENPVLTEGVQLFIPGGQIIIPTPVYVQPIYSVSAPPSVNYNIPQGEFINPLINCPGYVYIRGFTSTHYGVDMAKAGGCWVSAAGDGVVTKAGWGSMGEGWHVVIDHGNGVKTWYLHSNGQFKVKAGDQVKAGQIIMYMGCTGNCTGTHLHFAFWINGQPKNPENYVKLR